ncbi:hypothetical protein SELMODRAFT_402132 [Selaginella moellendorffii]|uniref:PB1 domain-containing protein n=2 Tax=Selaginella moellendorffii TaxID=88036 RepID=D8QPP5_SELML|nr:hypothetical protein SELMODRAFT_402132 [Selaginella moellendorffii]
MSEDESTRVKLMCSYGGRIVMSPHDSQLRYIGGDTRIFVVPRTISYADFRAKLSKICGGRSVLPKYKLPYEDFDALVSIFCDDDLEAMLEEYERLDARDSPSKLRLFLFPTIPAGHIPSAASSEQSFLDALNNNGIIHEEQLPDYLFASSTTPRPRPVPPFPAPAIAIDPISIAQNPIVPQNILQILPLEKMTGPSTSSPCGQVSPNPQEMKLGDLEEKPGKMNESKKAFQQSSIFQKNLGEQRIGVMRQELPINFSHQPHHQNFLAHHQQQSYFTEGNMVYLQQPVQYMIQQPVHVNHHMKIQRTGSDPIKQHHQNQQQQKVMRRQLSATDLDQMQQQQPQHIEFQVQQQPLIMRRQFSAAHLDQMDQQQQQQATVPAMRRQFSAAHLDQMKQQPRMIFPAINSQSPPCFYVSGAVASPIHQQIDPNLDQDSGNRDL